MIVTEVLNRIDWNFPRGGTDVRSPHSAHWFPGNFIPQLPTAFIQALSAPGDLVFDPFGGSGTTAVEAVRLGRRAILSDRLTACVMIGRGKIAVQTSGLSRQTKAEILAVLTWRHECRSASFGSNGEGADPYLLHWFAPETLSQLRYLWKLIERQMDHTSRRILTLLFSDVLFACASPGLALTSTGKRRRHHWGWVADNVHPKRLREHDAIGLFEARLVALSERLPSGNSANVLVVQQDARALALPANFVDLIVTSPPYISVIDYARANRLFYTWMGWPLDAEREQEIGARFKRRRLQAIDQYLVDMRSCWTEIHRVLRTGAYCAIVIGESRRFPGTVHRTITDLSKLMPIVWGPITRNPSRRRVSDRASNDAVEYLYLFRKS